MRSQVLHYTQYRPTMIPLYQQLIKTMRILVCESRRPCCCACCCCNLLSTLTPVVSLSAPVRLSWFCTVSLVCQLEALLQISFSQC